jgi:hypothetical protein
VCPVSVLSRACLRARPGRQERWVRQPCAQLQSRRWEVRRDAVISMLIEGEGFQSGVAVERNGATSPPVCDAPCARQHTRRASCAYDARASPGP